MLIAEQYVDHMTVQPRVLKITIISSCFPEIIKFILEKKCIESICKSVSKHSLDKTKYKVKK